MKLAAYIVVAAFAATFYMLQISTKVGDFVSIGVIWFVVCIEVFILITGEKLWQLESRNQSRLLENAGERRRPYRVHA